eukprot:458532_1
MSSPTSPHLQQASEYKQDTDAKITQMKNHLSEISKLMENIKMNTNSIDDEVKRCEKIINDTFTELSTVLQKRKDTLLKELQKTAKNKKLSLLLQMNELTNKYQESQNTINKLDEAVQNEQINSINEDEKQKIDSLNNTMQKQLTPTNFDLRFSSNHSKQLIQMINHFGNISANPIPILLSLNNNGKNFVVEVQWKLPSNYMGTINIKKTQKLRIEWSGSKQLLWNHKEFIISLDNKKENNKSENGQIQLINVGDNGRYIFKIKHYYFNSWSKNSNTKSITISGISFDYWDNIYHGNNISVEGKCIVKKNNIGYESAFLSNIAMNNIHKWKFKVEGGHKSGSTRIFGVWRINNNNNNNNNNNIDENKQNEFENNKIDINKVLNTYFTNEKLVNPNSDQSYGKPFGDKCREGDEIDMILDLGKLKLFYKLNGIMYGKPIDIARANYRACVSFYCVDDKIRLLGYRKDK